MFARRLLGTSHGTAAIELILPTYAAQRGLKGKIARHFVLNPHPTLIPAIEAGFVDSIHCFGASGHVILATSFRFSGTPVSRKAYGVTR